MPNMIYSIKRQLKQVSAILDTGYWDQDVWRWNIVQP